jgi:hypothetical protein
VTRTTTKVLAGVAVAALAAAAVATLVNHQRGQEPDSDERAYLDELDARLDEVESATGDTPPGRLRRVLDSLKRNQDISVSRLRRWVAGVRLGTLSPEQAAVAEGDLDALEKEADQGGA